MWAFGGGRKRRKRRIAGTLLRIAAVLVLVGVACDVAAERQGFRQAELVSATADAEGQASCEVEAAGATDAGAMVASDTADAGATDADVTEASSASGQSDVVSATAAYGQLTQEDISSVPEENEGVSYAAGEVLILFDQGLSADGAFSALDALGLSASEEDVASALEGQTLLMASVVSGASVNSVLRSAAEQEGVSYAQANYLYLPVEIDYEETTAQAADSVAQAAADEADADATGGDGESDEEAPLSAADVVADALSPSTTEIDDPYASSQQWHLDAINAYDAWDIQKGEDATVAVAVIDTGADGSNPDLQGNIVAGYNVISSSTNYQDIDEHGTHVCGIVAATTNNDVGVSGVTYNAKVIPVMAARSAYDAHSHEYEVGFYSADIVKAYQYLLTDADGDGIPDLTEEYGLHVINLSLGGEWSETADDKALQNYIDVAYEKDIVTVCASGNEATENSGTSNRSWPADYETCVSVIALGTDLSKASYSNYGDAKDIAAPGSKIYSTVPISSGTYAAMSGTSMASPIVAGSLALLFAKNGGLSAEEALDYLYSTAQDLGSEGYDTSYGWGCVDLEAALEAVSDDLSSKANSGSEDGDESEGGGESEDGESSEDGNGDSEGAATVDISRATVEAIPDQLWVGRACEPSPTVSYGGRFLKEGADYEVSYEGNGRPGTATVTITGIGGYAGELACSFFVYYVDVPTSFADDPDVYWYYDAIYQLSALGVMSGYDTNWRFGVGDSILRQDVVTMLWRYCCPDEYAAYDASAAVNGSGLADVEDGMYYTAAVNWAVEQGIVTGYTEGADAGTFGVGDTMTFEQLVTVLARMELGGEDAAAAYSTASLYSGAFADASQVSEWAAGPLSWAVDRGLVTGYVESAGSASLAPLSDVERERVATVLARYIDLVGESE